MKYSFCLLTFSAAMAVTGFPAKADSEVSDECDQTENVHFIANDVFDLTDPETIFLHHWANYLHIKTQDKTLINEAAFFLKKCEIDELDLAELERHLRRKRYIRDASVKFEPDKSVKVQTWDNWSLLPTIDFSRKGGQNKFSMGIMDRNLLGLGIDVELEYFTDDQRSGYQLATKFPLFMHNNTNAVIQLSNNTDGTSRAVFISKQFVSFDTKNAYTFGFHNFDQIDTQYLGGRTYNRFQHDKSYALGVWSWLHSNTLSDTLRFGVGYEYDKHSFLNVEDGKVTTQILPHDREFNYPFIQLSYLQKDYRELVNLKLINHIEDFNLGWEFSASLGTDISNSENAAQLIWRSQLSKGHELFSGSLIFWQADLDGEYYANDPASNRLSFTLDTELFQKLNDRWGVYFKNRSQLTRNQFLDTPVALGGDSGLRGFPLQYQYGKHSTQFTFEMRYYPQINLFKLLELGGAAFVDTGKVFGKTDSSAENSAWMTSIGLGARLYSTHSSESRVIHMDVIKPMTSGDNINGVEFRLTTKTTF